ncbi:MAG: ADP-forming succinate--CoA ligase subunit beta [Candidatus Omnitrophica bacterium]|nr:ADP-forming succinate--CoA ligase subunit beta [Candidatus Omnitrophota bacterium]
MKIHEYQAIEIFQKEGVPVIDGHIASESGEAAGIAKKIGYPVVLKAQVLAGGRGKAGGIKFVEKQEDLEKTFRQLQELKIKEYGIEKILVARAVDIKEEFYVGIAVDNLRNSVVLIASSSGGIDIEATARENPGAIRKFYLNKDKSIDKTRWLEFICPVFKDSSHQQTVTAIFQGLIRIFFDNDCSLVEINPLVIDGQGEIFAADAKINFDDNALFRHEDIYKMRDLTFEDPDEREAEGYGLSFVKLDGNVGCIVNGAGLAMGTMDMIQLTGGQPANFLDVGGSSDPEKVLNAIKIILKNKNVKVILINIFGGITRCDDIAKGILEAKKQLDISAPLIVRLAGTNEGEGQELLTQNGIRTFSTMREAVSQAVRLGRES